MNTLTNIKYLNANKGSNQFEKALWSGLGDLGQKRTIIFALSFLTLVISWQSFYNWNQSLEQNWDSTFFKTTLGENYTNDISEEISLEIEQDFTLGLLDNKMGQQIEEDQFESEEEVGRFPASIKKVKKSGIKKSSLTSLNKRNKLKKKALAKRVKSPLKVATLNRSLKPALPHWSTFQGLEVVLEETYVHNSNIYGTYKLKASQIMLTGLETRTLSRNPSENGKEQPVLFKRQLTDQLGSLVLKSGKMFWFRPISQNNTTNVLAIDFPFQRQTNKKSATIVAKVDEKIKDQLIKIRSMVDIDASWPEADFSSLYSYDVTLKCQKPKSGSYTCFTKLVFNKSQNSDEINDKKIASNKFQKSVSLN